MNSRLIKSSGLHQQRRGAMAVLIAVCLPLILIFTAFAINIAWMQLTRTELRTATDSAAKAGSRTLSLTQDPDAARAAAIEAAARNSVAGAPLELADTDVEFGKSLRAESGKWIFTALPDDSDDLTAVRITGSRTEASQSGAVPLLFAGIFDRGDFEPVKYATASQLDRDVMIVLDRSGSMGGKRWRDLKKAVVAFLKALKGTPLDERVGVVTYSSDATTDAELTGNYGQLMRSINSKTPGGGTAIGLGLENGIAGIRDRDSARRYAAKSIVLMTDGNHNTGIDPEIVAREAHDTANITVHTITFSRGADQAHMRRVAEVGGGNHWHADSLSELTDVFEAVANNLPTLLTE